MNIIALVCILTVASGYMLTLSYYTHYVYDTALDMQTRKRRFYAAEGLLHYGISIYKKQRLHLMPRTTITSSSVAKKVLGSGSVEIVLGKKAATATITARVKEHNRICATHTCTVTYHKRDKLKNKESAYYTMSAWHTQ